MDLATLESLVQSFLDFYILGASADTEAVFPGGVGAGIRHRSPAIVGIPPEYASIPVGLDEVEFRAGEGPEPSDVNYLFLDRCSVQRAVVSRTDDGLLVEFFFQARFGPGEFDPAITQPICLPTTGDEPSAIASECLNRVRDFLGTDASLVGTEEAPFFPSFSVLITSLDLTRSSPESRLRPPRP
jgi:hypothetical protein